ncbi:DUF2946 family protein [Deinococcus oregonensis]|uniref:DUF2946 family protein n=1 Tax=Deinococcus oregonensis TaxID=1805970 RepID=A0ABV6AXT7_9DEIO
MQRRWGHRGKRWWAALLTVLAAFAFPVRGPLMSVLTAPQAAPSTDRISMDSMPMHHAGADAQAPTSHQDDHLYGHQAHCLFCLTGAFALEADPTAPPSVPVVDLAPASPVVVQARTPTLRHTDARAPPQPA